MRGSGKSEIGGRAGSFKSVNKALYVFVRIDQFIDCKHKALQYDYIPVS